MSFQHPHRDNEAEMQAWAELHRTAAAFDKLAGTNEEFVLAIGALIDVKVAAALEEFADRVQEATGLRP